MNYVNYGGNYSGRDIESAQETAILNISINPRISINRGKGSSSQSRTDNDSNPDLPPEKRHGKPF